MMSHQDPPQGKLFYMGINLEKRIRKNHPLRKIKELVDFEFIYNEVRDKYGYNGNESVPPPVILKLMLLLVFYNVRSERELMETVEERLDWLWFLDYDLDTQIPNHSVLSKARKRWGDEAFRKFYERILWQCVKAGLVDGSKIFVDSSLVDADASNNSVVDTQSLKRYLNKSYMELEKRLEEKEDTGNDNDDDNNDNSTGSGMNKRYVSTTDPDASITRAGGKPKQKRGRYPLNSLGITTDSHPHLTFPVKWGRIVYKKIFSCCRFYVLSKTLTSFSSLLPKASFSVSRSYLV